MNFVFKHKPLFINSEHLPKLRAVLREPYICGGAIKQISISQSNYKQDLGKLSDGTSSIRLVWLRLKA